MSLQTTFFALQINTDPMKSQIGYLNVVGKFLRGFKDFLTFFVLFCFKVSPDILDDPTSQDIIVQEYENVTLSCTATGSPGWFVYNGLL